MKIQSIRTGVFHAQLITPFKTALRTVKEIEDILVIVETDGGIVGYGEAQPTKPITGETKESILQAIQGPIRKALIGMNLLTQTDEVFQALDNCMPHNTSAKAAVDIALFDLLGKAKQQSVVQMLGGTKDYIETDLTISVNDPETMANDAKLAIQRGFHTLKIKVGIDPTLDIERLIAVRQAVGKDTILRVDANQAWTAKQAVQMIQEMESQQIHLELVEQPVQAKDLEGLQYVTQHSSVPIVADESCFSFENAKQIIDNHLADMVNIKLMKCGGLHTAIQIADYAQKNHHTCMIGAMLESRISHAAAVSLACAKPCITKIDLDGPSLCKSDPIIGGCLVEGPNVYASKEPGFGIQGVKEYEEIR